MTATLTNRDVRAGAAALHPGLDSAALASMTALAVAVGLWVVTLVRVDVRGMDDTGLVSILPWTGAEALAVLALGFGGALLSRRRPKWLLVAYPLTVTALLYVTPPVVYGTPRYSWVWKHAGIVDYIERTGGVAPYIEVLPVYHSWPGFFAFNAMLTDLSGLESSVSYAAWAELFFNILTVGAAAALLRTLCNDNRTVAVGVWLFALGNWVGQGYFAPQAMTFVWYLLTLTVLLRWLPGRRAADLPVTVGTTARTRVLLMGVVLLFVYGMVTTHQLTPLVFVMVVTALAVSGRVSTRALPVFTAAAFAAWLFLGADPYTRGVLAEMISDLGALNANVDSALIGYENASQGQIAVSLVTRGLTAAIGLLALAGMVASLLRGERRWTGFALAATPFLVTAVSPYGDEIIFRAYLFAVVGLAFFGALFLWRPGAEPTFSRVSAVVLVSTVLLGAAFVAQFGNDRQNRFTPGEVAAAEFVYGSAPPNTLLVEGSRNYPSQFENYERFVYVALDREPAEDLRRIVDRPAQVLRSWLSDDRYAAGYVIITRSQMAETEALGLLPGGGLRQVDRSLRSSPWFRVAFEAPGARVYVLDENPRPRGAR
ncbi:MAG TPA: hypothetical protein VFR87_15925 [Nocardioidaceae bacterium]|nr:hypothetical protein [Nocardioidaceae bacterium]